MSKTSNQFSQRTLSRIFALRLLYQQDVTGSSIQSMLHTGSFVIENQYKDSCECLYIDDCQPRQYFDSSGQWPVDYACPYESLDSLERKAACRKSTVCRCRRYYVEFNKQCPPAGYPYTHEDQGAAPCRCPHYATCDYRWFYDTFAEAPDGYACELAYGVEQQRKRIDDLIESTSEHWALYRMPMVDRNILRIAVFEILKQNDEVPVSVAINEAVSVAKEYGGEDSSKFINGVLGKIAREIKVGPDSDEPNEESL